ncbi:zinc finger, AN1-type domain, partial [Mortierella sp. GBA43]
QDHWKLENHACPNKDKAAQQDQRVPMCPLCNKPVPVRKGEDPNVRMEQHISAGCPEPATTTDKPIYTNACRVQGCKSRSAIPIVCQTCRQNYCLNHRLESKHDCSAKLQQQGRKPQGPGAGAKNGTTALSGQWASKISNATRNVRAAAAAESRAAASSTTQRPAGKKDNCIIS